MLWCSLTVNCHKKGLFLSCGGISFCNHKKNYLMIQVLLIFLLKRIDQWIVVKAVSWGESVQKRPLWLIWKYSAQIRNAIPALHVPSLCLNKQLQTWTMTNAWLFRVGAPSFHKCMIVSDKHATSGHTGGWRLVYILHKSLCHESPALLVHIEGRSIWTLSVFPYRAQLYRPT